MSEDDSLFGSSILENYHRYLVPLIFEDYARDLAARVEIPASGHVLETACGTGVLTKYLQTALSDGGQLVATDINPSMVQIARANLNGHQDIEFHEADGTALPFDDDTFDVVTCQFGVMFFPDRDLGYREAARVLKPGGSFVFNVWDSLDHNPFPRCIHEKVVAMAPDNPPGFLAVPFGYHDLSRIKIQLQDAGFTEIHMSVLPRESSSRPSLSDLPARLGAVPRERAPIGRLRPSE
jgi:SAM-dependent methyltransferase